MADKDTQPDSKGESKKGSQAEPKDGSTYQPISDKQRFRYIGFEVYPGTPKDLFKNDEERKKYVDRVLEREKKGETLRENNTLVEERVSILERMVLAVACLIVLGSLFLPWYSAYTEVPATGQAAQAMDTLQVDTLEAVATDTVATAAVENPEFGETAPAQPEEVYENIDSLISPDTTAAGAAQQEAPADLNEEIITGGVVRKVTHKEQESVNWFGAFGLLGSASGMIFSGGVLAISSVILLIYMVLTVLLPLFTLYVIFGTGAKGDDYALKLKKLLKINWIPVLMVFVVFLLSFFGGSYGFDATSLFDSLGTSYGVAAFANTVSWGLFVSMVMFILLAVKAIEI